MSNSAAKPNPCPEHEIHLPCKVCPSFVGVYWKWTDWTAHLFEHAKALNKEPSILNYEFKKAVTENLIYLTWHTFSLSVFLNNCNQSLPKNVLILHFSKQEICVPIGILWWRVFSEVRRHCGYYLVSVPMPNIVHWTDSCRFSKCTWF
jgi:hypothetical protein